MKLFLCFCSLCFVACNGTNQSINQSLGQKEMLAYREFCKSYDKVAYIDFMKKELGTPNSPLLVDTIALDIEKTAGEHRTLSQVANIDLIPLETSPRALMSQITKAYYRDGKFYLFDAQQHKLLVFDRLGKFVFQVGGEGKGPGEYYRLDDFTLDYHSGRIALLDADKERILVFDEKGAFLKELRIKKSCTSLDWCGDKIFLSGTVGCLGEKGFRLEAISPETGQTLLSVIPFDSRKEDVTWFLHQAFSRHVLQNHVSFYSLFVNHVYQINTDGCLIKALYFDYGEFGVPPVLMAAVRSKPAFSAAYQELAKKKLCYIGSVFELDDYVCSYIAQVYSSFMVSIYSKKSGKSEVLIYNDLLKLSWRDFVLFRLAQFCGVMEGNRLIGVVSAEQTRNILKGLKKANEVDQSLMKYVPVIESLSDDDNPVLVLAKITMNDE